MELSPFKKNLSWIFFGNIVHAILQFALNVYCARQFGADDYGLLNYSGSLIAFFIAIGSLGFGGVITKFYADDEQNAGKYIFTSVISRLLLALLSIAALQFIIGFDETCTAQLRLIVFCQSLQMLFVVLDMFVHWFRYKHQAKAVTILRLLSFAGSAVWRFIAIMNHNLVWYTLGVSVEALFFLIFLVILYRKEYRQLAFKYDWSTFRSMLKLSYPFIFSALLSTIYAQTDKVMLKNMVDYASVGIYSVSQTLAGAIVIIPVALIEGFRPEIMVAKTKDEREYSRLFRQLYGIIFWLCIAYCLFITVFAEPIVKIIYGPSYIEAVASLSVIVWYTSFSYFGAVNHMYMVAEEKTFWVQIVTLSGALLNVVLNLLLIPRWSIVGAAWASLITQFVTNYVLLWLIKPLRPCFSILNRGIAFKWGR